MMKYILLPLFLFGIVLLGAEATLSSSIPANGDGYRQTLQQLQKQVDSGIRNADLYYNIGVCHYHLGSSGNAVLWFLRALNLDSSHKPARENLDFIQNQLPQEYQAPPRLFLVQILFTVYDFLSLNRLALIALLALLLVVICGHWLLHYSPDKEKGLPVLLLGLALVILLVSGSALAVKYHRFRNNRKAVISLEATALLAAPDPSKAPVSMLPEGLIVIVRSSSGSFLQVLLPDGSSGWVKASTLQRVSGFGREAAK